MDPGSRLWIVTPCEGRQCLGTLQGYFKLPAGKQGLFVLHHQCTRDRWCRCSRSSTEDAFQETELDIEAVVGVERPIARRKPILMVEWTHRESCTEYILIIVLPSFGHILQHLVDESDLFVSLYHTRPLFPQRVNLLHHGVVLYTLG